MDDGVSRRRGYIELTGGEGRRAVAPRGVLLVSVMGVGTGEGITYRTVTV